MNVVICGSVTISRQTYMAAVASSGVPTEERWPPPRRVTIGSGYRYEYDDLDADQREDILSHLSDLYVSLAGSGDSDALSDRRAIKRDLIRNGWRP